MGVLITNINTICLAKLKIHKRHVADWHKSLKQIHRRDAAVKAFDFALAGANGLFQSDNPFCKQAFKR